MAEKQLARAPSLYLRVGAHERHGGEKKVEKGQIGLETLCVVLDYALKQPDTCCKGDDAKKDVVPERRLPAPPS